MEQGVLGMSPLNRAERQTLRRIQGHLHESFLRQQAVTEQLGTVDVYFHPHNAAPMLNCVVPHRGVAWVRYEDLADALTGLRRLGRRPRLLFLDALFPDAFVQQLRLMGMQFEAPRPVLVYRPMFGPMPAGEIPLGRLPDVLPAAVRATPARTRDELAIWWDVFCQLYRDAEQPPVTSGPIEPLLSAIEGGHSLFVTAWYADEPLGVARVMLLEGTAELDLVRTVPLWHGMGLEEALITVGTRAALDAGHSTEFVINPLREMLRLYVRLGFSQVSRLLTCIPGPEDDDEPARSESQESKETSSG